MRNHHIRVMNKRTIPALFLAVVLSALIILLAFTCKSSPVDTKGDKKEEKLTGPMRGLYIPFNRAANITYVKNLHEAGKPYGVNMYVLDVHSYNMNQVIDKNVIGYLSGEGAYLAARIVCFQDGLGSIPVPESHMKKIYILLSAAAAAGFHEIQLDYIRFKDTDGNYSMEKKYRFIEGLLSGLRAAAVKHGVKLSADIFGRIVFNRNDNIGQQLELFARHVDVVYPMLYPSHFLDNEYWMSRPGETVKEGVMRGLVRLKGTGVLLQPYIQCFKYNIQWSRLTIEKYVEAQITAAEATEARGWVAWNAAGEYGPVFEALKSILKKEKK